MNSNHSSPPLLITFSYLVLFHGTVGTVAECHMIRREEILSRKPRTILLSETLTTSQRAKSEGYPAETHKVITEDRYILELHRIPFGVKQNDSSTQGRSRPVILLMHCLMCSSIDWLMNFPDKALGFILADEGYDVWMVNGRGNMYSRSHVSLSPNTKEFWLFSWHEIAVYDLPASIDYALKISGTDKLSYIGYSMGSALFYALMSEKPEYNEKVNVAAILGPAAYITHSLGTIFRFSPVVDILEKTADFFGLWEFNPQGKVLNSIATTLCSRKNYFFNNLCLAIYSMVMAIDEEFANMDFLPLILSHIPAGGSLRTLTHFMQIKNADRFQQYSYGVAGNLKTYGTYQPPLYYINRTLTPVGLFTARGDKYVRKQDVDRLARQLPNVALRYDVPNAKFSHFDFLWAKDATEILYDVIIQFLKKYL